MQKPGVNPGTRVRLVCSSCRTLCEVVIPGTGPKPVRYQVRCPNCKAINDPQIHSGSTKPSDLKRKVRRRSARSSVPARTSPAELMLLANVCAGNSSRATTRQAAARFGDSGAKEVTPGGRRGEPNAECCCGPAQASRRYAGELRAKCLRG